MSLSTQKNLKVQHLPWSNAWVILPAGCVKATLFSTLGKLKCCCWVKVIDIRGLFCLWLPVQPGYVFPSNKGELKISASLRTMPFSQKIFHVGLLGCIFFSLPSLHSLGFSCLVVVSAYTLRISACRWAFLLPVIRWFTNTAAHRFACTFTYVTRFWILCTNCYQSNRLTIELHHF